MENQSEQNFFRRHLRYIQPYQCTTLVNCTNACGLVLSSVSRCLEPVMKHEARVFDILHKEYQLSLAFHKFSHCVHSTVSLYIAILSLHYPSIGTESCKAFLLH